MTVLRVKSAIATDTGNTLVGSNMIKQPWQDGRIANTVVGHFHGPDFERGRFRLLRQ